MGDTFKKDNVDNLYLILNKTIPAHFDADNDYINYIYQYAGISDFTYEEFRKIKEIFHPFGGVFYGYLNNGSGITTLKYEIKVHLGAISQQDSIVIHKFIDEWYVVCHTHGYNNKFDNYKCDQYDGLVD